MNKMRKLIALSAMIFFLSFLIPSGAFSAEETTAGAAKAGSTAGKGASEGIGAGTIGIGVAVVAVIVGGGIAAFSGGGSSNTVPAAVHH